MAPRRYSLLPSVGLAGALALASPAHADYTSFTFSPENPYYNLMMFPYPSAEGLHVGNIYAFTGADVHGRYHRLRGRTVFEPIGFDAFGIHSENFALKVGVHPMDLIPSNVANFTRQLRRIGGMFDWDHTVDTTDPAYYKWTQWVFVQLFKAGLAERRDGAVNWCPSCKTVLANEQVIQGLCERCDTPVEQRDLPQWYFRITDYAQRLLDNLETLDWSETTRKAQQNWIGRSEGGELRFPMIGADGSDTDASVHVFITRPDTIFGASYMCWPRSTRWWDRSPPTASGPRWRTTRPRCGS